MAGTTVPPAPTAAPVVGIDVSARWFDVARGAALRRFQNTAEGIAACVRWLGPAGPHVRVGLEATGTYSLPLATALHAAGHTVFVCNPLSLARYRQATLARTKTDKLDARCIARFCAAHALHPWAPTSAAHQRLHVLVATRQTLLAQAQQLRNRQHAAGSTACPERLRELQAPVLAALAAQLAHLDRELAALAAADTPLGAQLRLLTTVPGLGLVTAATLVATRQTLLAQAHQLRNRQHAPGYTPCPDLVRELQAPVLAALAAQLARIEQELARVAAADTPIGTHLRLLTTIPGIGLTTTATLVASLPVARLTTPKQALSG